MSENINEADVEELVSILQDAPQDAAEALLTLLELDDVSFHAEDGETVTETLVRVTREQPAEVATTILTVLVLGSAMQAAGVPGW